MDLRSSRRPPVDVLADLKGASSVAHVYGKSWTGSEAFTSFARPWASTPQTLKHVADLQLSLGVTRFCIHTSPHQPLAVPLPGIALAPSLGQAFTVNETWSGVARPWIDYLARCSAMLNAGRPAVDVAVFIGEEAPVTALPDPSRAVPAGFDFDYVGADALRDVLRVENGDIVSGGSDYRLLYHLGGSSQRMTVATLRQLERLLDDGATVVGLRPSGSPSLLDSSTAFDDACESIWSGARTAGTVVATTDLGQAMRELGMRPFLDVEGAELRQISREVDGQRLTFLANPGAEPVRARLLTSAQVLTAWDPVRVRSEPLTADLLLSGDGRRSFTITLPSFGSLFVLAAPSAPPSPHPLLQEERYVLDGSWTLSLPGTSIGSTMSPQPRLWTDESPSSRTFSGTGRYRLEFQFGPEPRNAQRFLLDLGDVRDIARVVLNGQDCGVAWTAPFEVDVSAALRRGANTLEVEITNPWRNRLIAEAWIPSGDIFEPMTTVFHPMLSRCWRTLRTGHSDHADIRRTLEGTPVNARTPDQILAAMSWEDKLAQLQIIWRPSLDEATELARSGIGALFWPGNAANTNALQRAAVEKSAHGIPLLIGLDVVHGQFTIFPTPLAQAASFDPGVAETDARVSAGEARSAGVTWTFSPMVDVSRDPRWGRVVEGFGEDAHVNAVFGAAKVRGYQGDDLAQPGAIAACLKHFVGYGAAEAGRDYNTTDISAPPQGGVPRAVPTGRGSRSGERDGGFQLPERNPDAREP